MNNVMFIDSGDLIFNYDNVYKHVNFLNCIFNPKIVVVMHFSCKVLDFVSGKCIFIESSLPDFIIDDWFDGIDPCKVVLVWNNTYFNY
jgi:hypothetical protein